MNLAWKDIRRQGWRFLLTGVGLGLLFAIVLGMLGIYRGLVADSTAVVDALDADLWVVQRGTRGPFAEPSVVPHSLEDRLRLVPGVATASSFTYATIQRGDGVRPLRIGLVGLSWPRDRGEALPLVAGRVLGSAHREMIVDRTLGLPLGTRLTLADDEWEIVGITQGFFTSAGDAMAFVTARDAAEIIGWTAPEAIRLAGGRRPSIQPSAATVTLLPGVPLEEVRARISTWSDVTVWTADQERDLLLRVVVEKSRKQMGMFSVLLSLVSGIIVALIVFNMTVAKTREIALIKLMGARTRVVVGLVLQQSLLLGAIGYLMANVVGYFIFPHFARRVLVTPVELTGLAVLVVAISTLASLAAIRQALRIPPTIVLGS